MGGYELVRSDDAAAGATGTDLECGASASKASPPSTAPSSTTSPAARQPRLVSLDVFRGITVLVRPPPPLLLLILIVAAGGGFSDELDWIGFSLASRFLPLYYRCASAFFLHGLGGVEGEGARASASIDQPTQPRPLIMRRRDEERRVSNCRVPPHDPCLLLLVLGFSGLSAC